MIKEVNENLHLKIDFHEPCEKQFDFEFTKEFSFLCHIYILTFYLCDICDSTTNGFT